MKINIIRIKWVNIFNNSHVSNNHIYRSEMNAECFRNNTLRMMCNTNVPHKDFKWLFCVLVQNTVCRTEDDGGPAAISSERQSDTITFSWWRHRPDRKELSWMRGICSVHRDLRVHRWMLRPIRRRCGRVESFTSLSYCFQWVNKTCDVKLPRQRAAALTPEMEKLTQLTGCDEFTLCIHTHTHTGLRSYPY